jgi:hypothetical protein
MVGRAASAVALVAIAVWLGGLLALGALAAPVVFSVVSLPTAADAMTIVFRRFDRVAMTCAAFVLATEAVRAIGRAPFARVDWARSIVSALAAALAVLEGARVSPRIAELHATGVIRGLGVGGRELARLHEWAELCGKTEVTLLTVAIALHVASLSRAPGPSTGRSFQGP